MKRNEIITKIFDQVPNDFFKVNFTDIDGYGEVKVTLITAEEEINKNIFIDETFVFNEEGDEILETTDIFSLDEFKDFLDCPDCHNENEIDVFVGCSRPASDCCGGCSKIIKCEHEDYYFKFLLDEL